MTAPIGKPPIITPGPNATNAEWHAFAEKHAPEFAEEIGELCKQVIAKGLTSILETTFDLQRQVNRLEKELADLKAKRTPPKLHQVGTGVRIGNISISDHE